MSVGAIGALTAATPPVSPVAPTGALSGELAGLSATQGGDSSSFASMLGNQVDALQRTQATADGLAVQAATGDLQDVHDYTIAATQASLATELAVNMRNKGLEAFNEIMRMPL